MENLYEYEKFTFDVMDKMFGEYIVKKFNKILIMILLVI